VLEIVVELHPDHLTIPELILKVATDRDRLEGEDVRFAIRDLRASGLLRYRNDDQVVEPTHAALLANELLLCV
jgi:Cdc6-like AAA superfamily ATPase